MKKIFAENLKIRKKILKLTKKIFSHYIINQPCLNNCDQCKNPEQNPAIGSEFGFNGP